MQPPAFFSLPLFGGAGYLPEGDNGKNKKPVDPIFPRGPAFYTSIALPPPPYITRLGTYVHIYIPCKYISNQLYRCAPRWGRQEGKRMRMGLSVSRDRLTVNDLDHRGTTFHPDFNTPICAGTTNRATWIRASIPPTQQLQSDLRQIIGLLSASAL